MPSAASVMTMNETCAMLATERNTRSTSTLALERNALLAARIVSSTLKQADDALKVRRCLRSWPLQGANQPTELSKLLRIQRAIFRRVGRNRDRLELLEIICKPQAGFAASLTQVGTTILEPAHVLPNAKLPNSHMRAVLSATLPKFVPVGSMSST